MYNEQCTLGAGSAAIPVQSVGLQVLVAKEPRGPNRTPEVCGRYDGWYVSCDVCMTGRKYEKYCKVMIAFMCSFELMVFRYNYTWRGRLFATNLAVWLNQLSWGGIITFQIPVLFPSPFPYEPISTQTKGFPFTMFLIFKNVPFCVIIYCFGQFARLIITDALETVVMLFRIEVIYSVFYAICIYRCCL